VCSHQTLIIATSDRERRKKTKTKKKNDNGDKANTIEEEVCAWNFEARKE